MFARKRLFVIVESMEQKISVLVAVVVVKAKNKTRY